MHEPDISHLPICYICIALCFMWEYKEQEKRLSLTLLLAFDPFLLTWMSWKAQKEKKDLVLLQPDGPKLLVVQSMTGRSFSEEKERSGLWKRGGRERRTQKRGGKGNCDENVVLIN